MVRAYLKFLLKARNAHSLHSPFVFDLYANTIRRDNPEENRFSPIRSLQRELLKDDHKIQITDFGAGSRINTSRERAIRDIAKNSQKPARFGRLLYRLIQRFESQTIVDLGTSLGITTLYEALAAPTAQLLTFEGCPQTASVAERNFRQLNCQHIEIITGNIDLTLNEHLAKVSTIDFAFFDANHRYDPTMRYFETCLSKTHNDTCFIFDDIHWSDEMEQAWETIKAHPAVTVSIDLFYIGVVFFRSQQPKQDFILKF